MRAYSERLSVPPAWWLIGGATTVLLGAELWAGFGVLAAVATYAVLAIVVGGTLLHWGSARVRVTDGELRDRRPRRNRAHKVPTTRDNPPRLLRRRARSSKIRYCVN